MACRVLAILLVAATAVGCGPEVAWQEDEGSSGGTDTAGHDVGDTGQPGDGVADGSTSGDVDDTGGTDDTGEPPVACIDDGGLARPIAVIDQANETIRIFEPGAQEVVLDASLPPGVDAWYSVLAVARDQRVAVVRNYAIAAGGAGAVLRLYDRRGGALQWMLELDYRLGTTFLDGQARVSAAVGWDPGSSPAGLLVVDGVPTPLVSFSPAGPIGPNGWVPGRITDPAVSQTIGSGLYNVLSDELVTVTTGDTPPGWVAREEAIEHIDTTVDPPRLVITRADGETALPLSPFTGDGGFVSTMASAGDYRLLRHASGTFGDPPRLVRAHVPTGVLVEIELSPPTGWSAFDCYDVRATIDADGRILIELRNEGAAQVHAWDPDQATWTPIGLPITAVEDVTVFGVSARVLQILGHGTGTTFCPSVEWGDPPAEALSGSSVQLVRIDPPVSLVVEGYEYQQVSVDPPEVCAAWSTTRGLTIHDLVDDDEIELPLGPGSVLWLD